MAVFTGYVLMCYSFFEHSKRIFYGDSIKFQNQYYNLQSLTLFEMNCWFPCGLGHEINRLPTRQISPQD